MDYDDRDLRRKILVLEQDLNSLNLTISSLQATFITVANILPVGSNNPSPIWCAQCTRHVTPNKSCNLLNCTHGLNQTTAELVKAELLDPTPD